MKIASLTEGIIYNNKRPVINILLETSNSKEIRIVFKKGQIMKEHKTPFPIVVQIFQGTIKFGVKGEKHVLNAGSIISLEGDIPHDLTAMEDSIVYLSLSKMDTLERVRNIKTT